MQVNWDEPKAFEYRASDEHGRIIGRIFRVYNSFEYSASVGSNSLGTYINSDRAKEAVERALRIPQEVKE